MENGEVIVSGGEKDLLTAYFENADPISVNTTSLNEHKQLLQQNMD